MILYNILSFINMFIPICIIVVIVIRQRILKRFVAYILVPSMLYISGFYIFYVSATTFTDFDGSLLKMWIRLGVSLILVCLLIYFITDLIVAKKIVTGYKDIEEK